jgi:hypothetical protein
MVNWAKGCFIQCSHKYSQSKKLSTLKIGQMYLACSLRNRLL